MWPTQINKRKNGLGARKSDAKKRALFSLAVTVRGDQAPETRYAAKDIGDTAGYCTFVLFGSGLIFSSTLRVSSTIMPTYGMDRATVG